MIFFQTYKIKDIGANFGDAPFGTSLKTKDYVDFGVPVIQGRNIKNNKFEWNNKLFVTEDKFKSLVRSHCNEGDLVFPKVGTIGICAIMPKVEERSTFLLSTNMMRMNVNPEIADIKYLYYYFSQDCIRKQIQNSAGGSSQPVFNFTTLKEFKVSLPPIPIQQKVASFLSYYDILIDNNTRRIKILEEMVQMIYWEWFVNFRFPGHEKVKMVESPLGVIPEGWEAVTLNQICKYVNRGVSPKYDDNSTRLVINQKCIRDNKLNMQFTRRHQTKVPVEKFVQFGDVLINSTGVGTLGRVTQVYKKLTDCTVDTHVTIIRPKDVEIVDYFGLTLINLQEHFEKLGTGATGQTELGRSSINDTKLIFPTISVLNMFSKIVSPTRFLIENLLMKNENLQNIRDLLLPKLISGQIDVGGLNCESNI